MDNDTIAATADATNDRKHYTAPTLQDFGSFSENTQGTFAGVGTDNSIYS